MQIQVDALEEVLEIEDAKTSSFENFDSVVETFDKAAGFSADEVVGDFLPPGKEPLQEILKAVQTTFLNLLDPVPDFGLSLFLREVHLEDGRELFSQEIGLFCRSRMSEEASQDFSLCLVQVFRIFAKGSKTTVEFLILFFR